MERRRSRYRVHVRTGKEADDRTFKTVRGALRFVRMMTNRGYAVTVTPEALRDRPEKSGRALREERKCQQ